MSEKLKNKDAERVVLNVSAVIVLSVMLLVLVFMFVYPWAKNKHLEPIQQQITITVKAADSTNVDLLTNSLAVDNLMSIVTAKEDNLTERYEYLLEQYKTEKEIRTTFSVILGLIISLIGFLGYRSIREIKLDVKSKAEEIAAERARSTAQIIANECSTEVANMVASTEAQRTADKIAREVAKDVAASTSKATARKISKNYLDENAKGIINNYIKEQMSPEGTFYQSMKGNIIEELKKCKKVPNKTKDAEGIDIPKESSDEELLKDFKK